MGTSYLLGLSQLPPDPVDVYDPLGRIVMTEYLGVEFAETLGFLLSQVVSR